MSSGHRSSGSWKISGRWIHLFEEDSARGAIYVPDGDDVPLSRRPRDGFEFHADGSVTVLRPSPDDRLVGARGRWSARGQVLVISLVGKEVGPELRGRLEAPGRLLVTPAPT